MEHGFTMRWVLVGAGAVVVAKILTSALGKYFGLAM
jgi:hypothetical protein